MPSTPTLTDRQLDVLRFLVARYQSDQRMAHRVRYSEIPRSDDEPEQMIIEMLLYFRRWGWVRSATNASVDVQQSAVDFLYKLDNPEPDNYLTALTTWWFSARWRAAITILGVILPLLVQWIEMIQTLLRWLGVNSVDK